METFWLIPVLLRIAIANGLAPFVTKHMTKERSRLKIFTLQFVFAFSISFVLAMLCGKYRIDHSTIPIFLMAFINCFGAYCQWRAIDISLSKNALFTIWDDIIPMALAYLLLSKTDVLNTQIFIGIAFSFLAIALFGYSQSDVRATERIEALEQGKHKPRFSRLMFFILGYSIPFGVTNFLMRYWAINDIHPLTFVSSWYSGSVLAATLMFLVGSAVNNKSAYIAGPVGTRNLLVAVFISVLIVSNQLIAFWATKLASIFNTQPIYLLSEIVIPSIIGFKVWKEHRTMTPLDWLAYSIALLAGIMIATGVHANK